MFEKRTSKGIWQNLYQFPLIETKNTLDVDKFMSHPLVIDYLKDMAFEYSLYNEIAIVHKLSHQHLYTKFWVLEVDALPAKGIGISELKSFPTPVLIGNFIEEFNFPI